MTPFSIGARRYSMMLKRNLAVIGICLVVFLLAGACLDGNSGSGTDPEEPGGSETDGGTGFVIMSGGDLNYYENDKFINTTMTFDDHQTPIAVSFTGNAVYVTTTDIAYPFRLWKCVSPYTDCNSIDNSFAGSPNGVSFNDTGNGFVATDEGRLDYYQADQFYNSTNIPNRGVGVSFTGLNVYVITVSKSGSLMKCDSDGRNCNGIDDIDPDAQGVSFDGSGNGYVLDGSDLTFYENDKYVKTCSSFDNNATAVSFTGLAVYVTTDDKELITCDDECVTCSTIDTFGSAPVGVSFIVDPG